MFCFVKRFQLHPNNRFPISWHLKRLNPRQRAILNQVAYECQRGRSWLQAISLLNEIRAQSAQSILLTFEKLGAMKIIDPSNCGGLQFKIAFPSECLYLTLEVNNFQEKICKSFPLFGFGTPLLVFL